MLSQGSDAKDATKVLSQPSRTRKMEPVGHPTGGRLVLVGTPIGNRGDLSPRAIETLQRADLVCCEDTRRTGRLLSHAGVTKPRLRRLDDYTELAAVAEVCRLLANNAVVAVVSDAGMPSLCDPGARIVAAAAEAGHQVTVVPGPSAGVAALVLSGFRAARHVFEGFLPRKGPARAARLAEIARETRTVVLFESPYRLRACLDDLAKACGRERRAIVARELTKLYEEVARGTLVELCDWAHGAVRGEVVVVIEGADDRPSELGDEELRAALVASVQSGKSRRDAAAAVAEAYGVSRRRAYNLLVARLEGEC